MKFNPKQSLKNISQESLSMFFSGMKNIPGGQEEIQANLTEVGEDLIGLIEVMEEPLLVLDSEKKVLGCNQSFRSFFSLSEDLVEQELEDLFHNFTSPDFQFIFQEVLPGNPIVKDFLISLTVRDNRAEKFLTTVKRIRRRPEGEIYFLSFRTPKKISAYRERVKASKNFEDILAHAPAMICLLKGKDHVFEIANDKYLQLIGKTDIIGKPIREVIPEMGDQGFFAILDSVYSMGQPYLGAEVPVILQVEAGETRKAFVDFLYQPTRNSAGLVDGIFVHAVEVTEKVEALNKLQQSKNRLRQLIDTMPAIVWLSDKERHTTYLNKSWYKYTGQTKKVASEFSWIASVHPEDKDFVAGYCQKAHEEQREFTLSFRLLNRNGKYRWVRDAGKPRYNAEGEFEGMIGTLVDIHEEKLKEELIREKEHRIRSVVDEANVATALYIGQDMRIELANEAMLELWGKDRSAIGRNLKDALPELEGQPFHQLLQDVFQTGETYWGKEDKVDLVKDGKLQSGFFNFTYKALKNEKGEIYGILNMALDVTETVRSKTLLKESESHFRQMANLMPEKVANTDAEGKLIYLNQNWLDFTGLGNEELQWNGWSHLIHPEERDSYETSWQQSLKTGADFEMELRFLDRFGNYKWHLSRAEAIRDDEGNIKMWIGNNTEIQKLKEEEKRKEDFLKMVSHELKTPVTSIKGYVQLLLSLLNKDSGADPSVLLKSSLLRIDQQIKRLTRLIGEILDVSRIEENKLNLQKSYFSINNLVKDTVQDICLTNTQYRISINQKIRGTVYADKDRIGQVLINLITNAIKYSPESQEVEVDIWSPAEGRISVSVRDKGIGIEPKNQKEIFRRFYRAGGKSEETYSGFGIGLYLAHEIIERHNGLLEVKSELGKGSEFTFILALARTNKT